MNVVMVSLFVYLLSPCIFVICNVILSHGKLVTTHTVRWIHRRDVTGWGLGERIGMDLLDLTSCGGCGLATHARRIHCFGGYKVEVLIIWDLI